MRFVPKKRTAVDGRVWWCVWDNKRVDWSTYLCHTKYRTKKAAQECIDRHGEEIKL